jgi:integrase
MATVRLRHVIFDPDRHGTPRWYFRKKGGPKKRLTGLPGSEEFMADYKDALAGRATVRERVVAVPVVAAVKADTLRWLCGRYVANGMKGLDERTQRVRRQILDSICDEPRQAGDPITIGDCPIPEFTTKAVKLIRDRKADLPESANGRIKALRQVFAWAIETEVDGVKLNPARDVQYLRSGSAGFHSWSIDEVEQFEATFPIGTKARLALALLLYTGQRRSDIVRFGPQHVRDGWLKIVQAKNAGRKQVEIEIPIIPELQHIIDATPSSHLAFLVTEFGKPFTANGFGNRMRKWCDDAGLSECAAHGLRKAAAARLAELGCSEKEIAAITGHETLKEVARYTKGARRRVLAQSAMDKLSASLGGRLWSHLKGDAGSVGTTDQKDEENQCPEKYLVPRGGVPQA